MNIVQEMWDIVMRVFGGGDTIAVVIMLVVVVAAGLALGQLNRIVQVTVGALVIAGLLRLAYTLTQGAEATALPGNAWNDLKLMPVGDLVVYFIAFAILISIVHLIRNTVQR